MIYHRTSLPLHHTLEEIAVPGLELFDLTANECSIEGFLDGYIPPHWHKEVEVFLLLEGEVFLEVEGQIVPIAQGEGCFINTGVLHAFRTKNHAFYNSFVFDASIVGGEPGSVFDVRLVQPLLKDGPAFYKIPFNEDNFCLPLKKAFKACRDEKPEFEFAVRDELSKIMIYLFHAVENKTTLRFSPVQDSRIKQCLSWIDSHLDSTVSVSDISSAANISERECQRLFKTCLHRSPMEYLLYRRLMKAAHMLTESDISITEAALACGFNNSSHFSRKFKELTGSTPAQYRKIGQET